VPRRVRYQLVCSLAECSAFPGQLALLTSLYNKPLTNIPSFISPLWSAATPGYNPRDVIYTSLRTRGEIMTSDKQI
jgi:hypothetical protein